MSKLDELIKELCPNGVEYKRLEEVCEFISGFAFKASLFKDEGKPICRTTNLQRGIIEFQDMICFNPSDYKEDLSKYIIQKNKIVIGMSGSIKIGINKSESICYLNQRVGMFNPNTRILNNAFLYYILTNVVDLLSKKINGSSVKNLSVDDVNNLQIPVPSLPVQEEIVRILDKFDDYCNDISKGLPAEIEYRTKQYEFYRDKLLTFKRLEA